MAAYADGVRYRAAWLADEHAFRLDDRDLELAHGGMAKFRRARRMSRMRGLAGVAAVAGALVVLGSFVVHAPAPTAGFALPPAVAEATARASARGLVLPGGERAADLQVPAMRSGQEASTPALEREREAAVAEYERGSRGAEAGARVVAALLATGELDAAGAYARECLRQHPDAVPLLVFAADVHYRADDLAGAAELLRHAARRAPGDPVVTLDLALVDRQLGNEAGALRALDRVARVTRGRDAALAARAKRERVTSP